jgi:hypothetical protein
MLTIIVPGVESFDERSQKFGTVGDVILELEHSLVSLSKWESEFEKPFLNKEEKTPEEMLGYIRAMILTKDYPKDVFQKLTEENFEAINGYLERKMTGTWINEPPGAPKSREIVTSELIYYWMTVFNIPFTCETWHLNRLFTLIRVCSFKNSKPKKMKSHEIAQRNRQLNAERKAAMGTKG